MKRGYYVWHAFLKRKRIPAEGRYNLNIFAAFFSRDDMPPGLCETSLDYMYGSDVNCDLTMTA